MSHWRGVASATASAALVFLLGCTGVLPVEPGGAATLEASQGIFVVHISSEVEIASMDFGFGGSVKGLPAGDHIALFVVRSGSYRWRQLELVEARGVRFRIPYEDEWKFRVEPGHINYAGMIILERNGWLSLSSRHVDRTAVAITDLNERFPELVARYPVAYSGPGRNVFPEHYRAALSQRRADGGAAAGADAGDVPR